MAYTTFRAWVIGPGSCPDAINSAAPEGYGPGCVALSVGGMPKEAYTDFEAGMTIDDLHAWLAGHIADLPSRFGLTPAAAVTAAARHGGPFLWTIFWDPTGQATPADPMPPQS